MRLLEVVLMTGGGLWQGFRQDFNLLEVVLVVLGIWAWRRGWLSPIRLPFPSMRHPVVVAIMLAAGFVALRLALIPLMPVPVPVVTDEFSHLLLADTLLHGRVANVAHPLWQHFESLHILVQPRYVSNYFPGHAVILAAARAAMGSAWAGVLAESGAFLAVLYWMLRGWMPARWALFGVMLAGLRFGIGSYWVNAYHGGFLAAIGGAIVAGAFPRLRRAPSVKLGVALGVGLSILATTRPFEGILFSLPFIAVLVWELPWRSMVRVGAPALLIAGITVIALGAYFSRITGSPFVTTYQISQKMYGWPMGFPWTRPPPVEHRHIELARYYKYELSERGKVDGPIDFIEYLTFRIQEYWRFFLGPVLTVPLVGIGAVWRRKRMLIIGLGGGLFAILLEGAASPHYLAPATAVIVAILVECCRHLRAVSRLTTAPSRSRLRISASEPRASASGMVLPATMVLVLALRIGAQTAGLPYTQRLNFQSWCCRVEGNMNKQRITKELQQIPGAHLVLVKAKTDHGNLFQWIYNDADIDASRIVWARDLGPERDAQLTAYFGSRQVWLVDPNVEHAVCRKY